MGAIDVADVEKPPTLQPKVSTDTSLGIYTADFYCVTAKVVIEVDGASHQSKEAKDYDAARDLCMRQQGLRILRFTSQVEHETLRVMEQIDAALKIKR